jgi:hypothetical protein
MAKSGLKVRFHPFVVRFGRGADCGCIGATDIPRQPGAAVLPSYRTARCH